MVYNMAYLKYRLKRLFKKCLSYIFWMAVRYVLRNGFNFWNAFDTRNGDIFDFGKGLSRTPTFQKMKTPGGIKGTFSSIKRNNKRSTDAEFEGRARRELFKTSPVKFPVETDRLCKFPRRRKSNIDSQISRQRRLRI